MTVEKIFSANLPAFHLDLYVECEECQTIIPKHLATKIDNNFYCQSCVNENFSICESCNEYINNDDVITINNDFYCQSCVNENFSICESCNEYVNNDDVIIINDNSYCQSCADDNFTRCNDCNEYVNNNNVITINRDSYCQDCVENNFTVCEHCNEYVNNDDVIIINDNSYCQSCADDNTSCEGNLIKEYHWHKDRIESGKFKLHFYRKEEEKENVLMLGVEVEVENCEKEIQNSELAKKIDCDQLFFEEDGSLRCGFEIISHPCSLEYHKELWAEKLDMISKSGFKAHDTTTAGLHIHFTKAYLTEVERIKLGMFFYNNITAMETIARRNCLTYARNANKKKVSDFQKLNYDRYEAINFANEDTIEIRLPRGTLKYMTFIATLEYVQAMCDYVKATPAPKVMKWQNFMEYVQNRKELKYLNKYLVEKGL